MSSVALALLLLGHNYIPNVGGFGELLDSVVPWFGAGVVVLALLAALARSRTGGVAVLAPLLAWAVAFGSWYLPGAQPAAATGTSPSQLRVATQNLYADNPDPASTARSLAATGADAIGIEEMTSADQSAVNAELNEEYPHHVTDGTIGLWSRYPISGTEPVDLGLSWTRGLRTHLATPRGDVIAYVVHLPSLRPGETHQRDAGLQRLSAALAADQSRRVVVFGDFNTASTDRQWTHLAPGYEHARDPQGGGPGFTWPTGFPIARLDHVLARGLNTTDARVMRTPGTDHRAVVATLAP